LFEFGGVVKIVTASCLIAAALVATLPVACSSGSTGPELSSTAEEAFSGVLPSTLLPPDCTALQLGWPSFGQNVCNTRSTPVAGLLGPKTASKLKVKWTYSAAGDVSATPAVVDGDVYVPDWGGNMSRINGLTGRPVWSISVGALIGVPTPDAGAPDGGAPADTPAPVVARDTPVVTADSVIFGLIFGSLFGSQPVAYVVSIDRLTGALKWATLVDSHPAAVVTSSPLLENGKLYVGVSSAEESFSLIPDYPCCSFRGSVVSLDATTGKLLWKTYTIDDATYFGDGGTLSGFAGAAVWSTPTLDRRRRSLYVTTGNNYVSPEGVVTLPPGDHTESIVSLDLDTGAVKWSQRMTEGDDFVIADLFLTPPGGGPDWDFGSGANLYRTQIGGKPQDVVGAGQKSGIYWAVDADSGSVLWKTPVGPGGHLGGIHWGTAVDSKHVYVGVNDQTGTSYMLQGTGPQAGQTTSVGSWAALDPATGVVDWQVANPSMTVPAPGGASVNGPLSAANGVVFGGSMDAQGTMFAFDGATGAVLWSFASGGSVYGGPAIGADGTVYWGNGYPNAARLLFGTPGGKLYAFAVSP
jgi:polyvinyl alcohol dehydrogenase (cytochrome)